MQINDRELYTAECHPTKDYKEFIDLVDKAIYPIIDQYVKAGFRLSDIEAAITNSINCKMCEHRLMIGIRNRKHKRELEAAQKAQDTLKQSQ